MSGCLRGLRFLRVSGINSPIWMGALGGLLVTSYPDPPLVLFNLEVFDMMSLFKKKDVEEEFMKELDRKGKELKKLHAKKKALDDAKAKNLRKAAEREADSDVLTAAVDESKDSGFDASAPSAGDDESPVEQLPLMEREELEDAVKLTQRYNLMFSMDAVINMSDSQFKFHLLNGLYGCMSEMALLRKQIKEEMSNGS
jgi:hypothetical protein